MATATATTTKTVLTTAWGGETTKTILFYKIKNFVDISFSKWQQLDVPVPWSIYVPVLVPVSITVICIEGIVRYAAKKQKECRTKHFNCHWQWIWTGRSKEMAGEDDLSKQCHWKVKSEKQDLSRSNTPLSTLITPEKTASQEEK